MVITKSNGPLIIFYWRSCSAWSQASSVLLSVYFRATRWNRKGRQDGTIHLSQSLFIFLEICHFYQLCRETLYLPVRPEYMEAQVTEIDTDLFITSGTTSESRKAARSRNRYIIINHLQCMVSTAYGAIHRTLITWLYLKLVRWSFCLEV